MIERVHVKNYKSIADVNVELGNLNVLVGRNGAGKSTFIDVLRFERDSLKMGLETAISDRNGVESIFRWTPQVRPQDIEIYQYVREKEWSGIHRFIIGKVPTGGYKVKREYGQTQYNHTMFDDEQLATGIVAEIIDVQNGRWIFGDQLPNGRKQSRKEFADTATLQLAARTGFNPGLAKLKSDLVRTRFYTIFPNTLREPQRPHTESILLDHGQNLGTALKHIKSQGLWFNDLVAAMNKLVGDIVDIRVKAVGGYLVTELRHESTGKRQKWFNLSQESDGTLRMLGLLVALYQDPAPTLIAIEEPELTIHPGALGLLCDILREASERTQILVTTQSPDLISHFTADELRIVERVNGNTEIGMIDEVQREAINSHLFSGGELLRIEGLHRETAAAGGAVNA